MTSNNQLTSRRIASALLALAATVALHGTWLSDLDRDAIAVTVATTAA